MIAVINYKVIKCRPNVSYRPLRPSPSTNLQPLTRFTVEPGVHDSKILDGSMQQSRISGGARGNPFSGTASNAASAIADTSNLKGKITSLEVSQLRK